MISAKKGTITAVLGVLALFVFVGLPQPTQAATDCPRQIVVNDGFRYVCKNSVIGHRPTRVIFKKYRIRANRAVFYIKNAEERRVVLRLNEPKILHPTNRDNLLKVTYRGRVDKNTIRMEFRTIPTIAVVESGSLTAVASPELVDITVVPGTNDVVMYRGILRVEGDSSVVVNYLELEAENDTQWDDKMVMTRLYIGGRMMDFDTSLYDEQTKFSGFTYTVSSSVDHVIFEVRADISAEATSGEIDMQVKNIAAYNLDTLEAVYPEDASGSRISGSNPLTTTYDVSIIDATLLSVGVSYDTPNQENNIMGVHGWGVYRLELTASETEDVQVEKLIVSFWLSDREAQLVQNIRLQNPANGLPIGSPVSALIRTVPGASAPVGNFYHAVFYGLDYTVPKGESVEILVAVDFISYEDGGFTHSGQTITPAILGTATLGGVDSIRATGLASGRPADIEFINDVLIDPIAGYPGLYGQEITLYRAMVSAYWASDTPFGSSSPNSKQTIGKIVVTNMSNSGNYSATVKSLSIDLYSTIQNTRVRHLRIYKDSLGTAPLADIELNGPYSSSTWTFSDVDISDEDFTDVVIAAGASKTFFITLDTTDARNTDVISLRVGANDIVYHDGAAMGDIIETWNSLPFGYKTLTF